MIQRPVLGRWFSFVSGLGCGCSLGWAAAPRAWWLALVGLAMAGLVLGVLTTDAVWMWHLRRERARGGER